MDPSVSDSCLHLSAVPTSKHPAAEGVPVSCQAALLPTRSSAGFPAGFATALPGSMQLSDASLRSRLCILGLASKVLKGARQDAALKVADRQVGH